jgi:hypothetical protein
MDEIEKKSIKKSKTKKILIKRMRTIFDKKIKPNVEE